MYNIMKKSIIINLIISIGFLISSCSAIDNIVETINEPVVFNDYTSYYEYKRNEIIYFKIDEINNFDVSNHFSNKDVRRYNNIEKVYCIGERLEDGSVNNLKFKEKDADIEIGKNSEVIYRREVVDYNDPNTEDFKGEWELYEINISSELLKNSYMSFGDHVDN